VSPSLLALVLSSTAAGPPPGSAPWIADVVAGRGPLPALAEVQDAAERRLARTDDSESWARRARWRGAVPRLDVALGTDADLDVRDSFAVARTRTTVEGRGFGFEIGARWELGDLVFARDELRASREQLAREAARRLLRDDATELYFERLAVLIRQQRSPSPEHDLAAARLDAALRALCGPLGREGDLR
jgi:hypothetical protein